MDEIEETIERQTFENSKDVKKYFNNDGDVNGLFIFIFFIAIMTSLSSAISRRVDQDSFISFADFVGAMIMGITMGIICISFSIYTDINDMYFIIIAAISGSISTHIFRRMNVNEGYIIYLFANLLFSKIIPEKFSMENYKKAMKNRRKEDRENE